MRSAACHCHFAKYIVSMELVGLVLPTHVLSCSDYGKSISILQVSIRGLGARG